MRYSLQWTKGMPTRRSTARWEGGLKGGKGTFKGESGAIGGQYNFSSRFEEGVGSNPEELLAAAEAACFSMALAGNLEKNGTPPASIDTEGACTVSPREGGFAITGIALKVRAVVPGIDDTKFQELARKTVETCPVSRTFHGNLDLTVEATLSGDTLLS
ncbi:MAG TPA: OsmC family peroxiredoxin [Gemmatimonadaceae bacterium]|nr:OsmC family peroxiredoxin [Gemmatimonadaceae bacterium]